MAECSVLFTGAHASQNDSQTFLFFCVPRAFPACQTSFIASPLLSPFPFILWVCAFSIILFFFLCVHEMAFFPRLPHLSPAHLYITSPPLLHTSPPLSLLLFSFFSSSSFVGFPAAPETWQSTRNSAPLPFHMKAQSHTFSSLA